jgi:predicted ATPase
LRDQHLLLVIDNFEHLLGDMAATICLRDMLQSAPHLKLLVTSRERLNLQSEWIFEVHGLPLPPADQLENLEAYSAVTLFVQSARRLQADFTLTAETQPVVAHICRLLAGLPLGIELAAAWVRPLSCQEIVVEIEQGLDFLAASTRDIPERHRSIKAVFDHSWQLLSEVEQDVLRQLSVFRGDFQREAAETVAGATLPILSALLDKSLLRRNAGGRYDLHELIQQYAAGQLQAEAAAEHATRSRHSRYYLTLLQSREPDLRSSGQQQALTELNADLDNIRLAWDEAVAHEQIDLLRDVAGSLFYVYELHQYFQEAEALFSRGVDLMETQLATLDAADDLMERTTLETVLGSLLAYQAFFQQRLGHNREAVTLYRASLDLLRSLNEPLILTFALIMSGIVYWAIGNFKEASPSLDEGLQLSRRLDNAWLQALAVG